MDDIRRIIYFLIVLGGFAWLCLIPAFRIIRNLIKLGTIKKQLNELGIKIDELQNKKTGKGFYIYFCGIILLFIIYAFLSKKMIILLYLLCFIPSLLDKILIDTYSKYNGIYENGIIYGAVIQWKGIFSWKKIDNEKISFLKQDGLRFDITSKQNQEEIIRFLKEKGIKEEV